VSDVLVRIRVGSESYALPVDNVLEVAELGDLAAVPGAGAGVLGVRNLQGQVLPVFDFAQVLGIPREGRALRLVVAEQDGRLAGLAVDEVTGVAPLGGAPQVEDGEFLTHSVLEGDGCLVGVVDVPQVFAALGRQTT
jgi:purine-binding chemotaxis protein CheW